MYVSSTLSVGCASTFLEKRILLSALYRAVSSLFVKLKPSLTLSVTSRILDFDVDQNVCFYPEYLQNKSIPDVLRSNKASRDISVAIGGSLAF